MPLPKCVRVLEEDTQSREALEADGWRYVETLVEMKRATEVMDPQFRPRAFVRIGGLWPSQLLEQIIPFAKEHMGPNRLLVDCGPTVAGEHRQKWIEDFGGEILTMTAERDDRLIGFLLRDRNRLSLMAAEGCGNFLVAQFISNAHRDGFGEVFLGTQEINCTALALYGLFGFRTYRRRVTYHKD